MSMDLRASSDCRGIPSRHSGTGERAEMSCAMMSMRGLRTRWAQRTNDLLYDSKLSREMLNGSFSLSKLR